MPRSNASDDVEKRRRILSAAFEAAERAGVAGARMDEVAQLAQVSKGTLYRFFRSKEELFLATILDSYESGVQAVDARTEGLSDPAEILAEVLDGLAKLLATVVPGTGVRYQAWGLIASHPELQAQLLGYLRDFHQQRQQQFEQLIRLGQTSGAFRADVAADVVARGIAALFNGFVNRATFDAASATPDMLAACFDTLVRGVLLTPPSAPAEGTP